MMNVPLFSAIFSISATVLIGVLMIAIIVMDMVSATFMIGAVVVGFLVSLPIALVVSKKLGATGK